MDGGQPKKRFAVFDIDGTIARTNLLQQLVRVLVSRGRLEIAQAQQIESMLHDYRQQTADEDFGAYMKHAADMLFQSVPKGISVKEYDEYVDVIVNNSLAHTYVYTRQLVQTLRQNNYFLLSISGSELRAVSKFSQALGFDAWVGQVQYAHDGKKLTGEIQTLTQPKDKVMQTLIQKFSLQTKGSIAVGDTSTDIPILSMVEKPIMFNPNQALFKEGRKKNWMLVIERKDMVYGFAPNNGSYTLNQVNID